MNGFSIFLSLRGKYNSMWQHTQTKPEVRGMLPRKFEILDHTLGLLLLASETTMQNNIISCYN